MSYQKILIDNTKCSRRFHITFDSEAKLKAKVKIDCPFCDQVIFEEENHPPVTLARQENLVQTARLSDLLVRECRFQDTFTEKTVASKKGDTSFLYPPQDKR